MKKVTYFGLLLAVALTGLSSCSSSDDVTSDPTNTKSGESRLTLTISTPVAKTSSAKGNSFAMGSRATDITTDPTATKEQVINRITVGIFSAKDNTVRTIQELSSGSGIGKFTQESNSDKATATIVTSSLADKDIILVACNAPTGTFNGVQTAAQFNAKTEDIDNSLATPSGGQVGASLVDNNIPMYGSSTLSGSGDKFSATVPVNHQTAKVTLSELTVDFDQNGPYKDASFTPTQIFLMNVPDDLQFNTDAATGTAKLWQGYKTSESATDYKEYLATPDLKEKTKELKGTSQSFGTTYYFYTMPNNKFDQGSRTKLVIMGTFKANKDDQGSPVYYPVPLNANYTDGKPAGAERSTTFAVYANKNYQCKVKIKTKGALHPTDDVTPQQADITVTVQDFVPFEQNTVFE